MFKVNEYFDSKVKSLAFQNSEGEFTVGVMAIGEYEFGTSTVEIMTVISGKLNIQFQDSTMWQVFEPNHSFTVDKGQKFKVRIEEPSAYLCQYK
jgi:purine/pyrimidine-nucleoside phosphorylase